MTALPNSIHLEPDLIELENEFFTAEIVTRGACLKSLVFKPLGHSVVMGAAQVASYLKPHNYLGSIVGPVANRLSKGQFSIGKTLFQLNQNEGVNTLHGGNLGTSELLWTLVEKSQNSVRLKLELPDKHMGFPGPLTTEVFYQLTKNTLEIEITAQNTQDSYLTFTPHIYFNLDGGGTVDAHKLHIMAESYLPLNPDQTPTGAVEPVLGKEFDFSSPKNITAQDLDHHFCLSGSGFREVLKLEGTSGVQMSLFSNQQGVQIYNGAHLGEQKIMGVNNTLIPTYGGLAIEPQGWVDSPNHPNFPSIFYEAAVPYKNVTHYKFST